MSDLSVPIPKTNGLQWRALLAWARGVIDSLANKSDASHTHAGVLVEHSSASSTSNLNLTAGGGYQEVLTRAISGLDSSKTYALHVQYAVTARPPTGGDSDGYRSRITVTGEVAAGPSLLNAEDGSPDYGSVLSGTASWEFTGKTSLDIDIEVDPFTTIGTPRVWYRSVSYLLFEV